MATLKPNSAPRSRIEAGDAVINAAEAVDTAPIKARLGRFAKMHGDYIASENAVRAAYAKQRLGEAKVGAADAKQDKAIDALSRALIGAGADKQNPFRGFGFEAPSRIKEQPPATREASITGLVGAVGESDAGKDARAAASSLGAAAAAVASAQQALGPLGAAHTKAKTRRDALARPWEAELSKLKNAARTADDEHGSDLFATLFVDTARPGPSRAGRADRVARRKGIADARNAHKGAIKTQRDTIAALEKQLAAARAALRALRAGKP